MRPTKHTPGPWVAIPEEHGEHLDFAVSPDGILTDYTIYSAKAIEERRQRTPMPIACVQHPFNGKATRANALVVAAAAELLEVLRSFPGFTDDATIGDPWIERKNAAIAKALGETA